MNKVFWLRVTCIVVLIILTPCYIFGDVIQVLNHWISGLAYGLAVANLIAIHIRRRRNKLSDFSGRQIFYAFVLVTLTLCYILGKPLTWSDWISGLVYGLALTGLTESFIGQEQNRRRRVS